MTEQNSPICLAKTFPQSGYFEIQFQKKDLLPVISEVDFIKENLINNSHKKDSANNDLVGNLEKEFFLSESHAYLNDFLQPYLKAYQDKFNVLDLYKVNPDPKDFEMQRCWVNFQKKHEFNPVHKHSGILSFVLWLEIPYAMEDEYNAISKKYSGYFEFLYNSNLHGFCSLSILADKEYQYKMLIFPSSTSHCVYPFHSSDGYRISVSGNFGYK